MFETLNQLKEYIKDFLSDIEIRGLWIWLQEDDITDEQIVEAMEKAKESSVIKYYKKKHFAENLYDVAYKNSRGGVPEV